MSQGSVMKKFQFIDALRGLAILGVIIDHAGMLTNDMPSWLKSLTDQGARGVQLFFVISAFTLFLSLNNRNASEKRPVINFFIRRFFRIAPLFYCAIVFFLIRDGFGPRHWFMEVPSITISNVISTVTFTNGWNPYWINSIVPGGWSVAAEMIFYLLVPYLFSKVTSLYKAIYLTLITLTIGKIMIFILHKHPLISNEHMWNDFLFMWFPNQLPIFCLGFVLYFLVFPPKTNTAFMFDHQFREKQFRKALSLLVTAIFMIIFFAFVHLQIIPGYFAYGIAFVLLALSLSLHPFTFIVNHFLCSLGEISFSAYIIHFSLLPIVIYSLDTGLSWLHLALPSSLYFLIFLIALLTVTIVVSSFTYRLIEQPGQALGRKLISKIESRI